MSDSHLNDFSFFQDSASRREKIIERFEEAWQGGSQPEIESYLPDGDDRLRLDVLSELVLIDFERRLKRDGTVRVEPYLARFPELANDPDAVLELIYEEYWLRRRSNPALALHEFVARFPDHAQALLARINANRDTHEFSVESTHALSNSQPREQLQSEPFSGNERFSVQRLIGAGSMGTVYQAFDRKLDRSVALKVLAAADADALYRFKQEFRQIADLDHANLVKFHELTADGKNCFISMELIEGVDFLSHVQPDGAIDLPCLTAALPQLVAGVAALHAAGILHRDIKPSNVMVTRSDVPARSGASETLRNGQIKLLDFGLLAVLNEQQLAYQSVNALLGTIAYMSPEQANCDVLSQASDWYSVGAMLFHALTGRLPFTGQAHEILRQKQRPEPPPEPRQLNPNVSPELNQLCVDLLQYLPNDRPTGSQLVQRVANLNDAEIPKIAVVAESEQDVFISRERELAALTEAFVRVQSGQTVCLDVHGESGVGKSTLVMRFTESLSGDKVLTLSGRCHERESLPFKAFDGLVDQLTSWLRRLSDSDVLSLIPRDVHALARVFPVLQRVDAVKSASLRGVDAADHLEIRRRAFSAMRELLTRIGDRWPIVLCCDDVQWADRDSALLLLELLRPPDAPRLLFISCYRSDEAEQSSFLQTLNDARSSETDNVERTEIVLTPLTQTEAENFVMRLLDREDADVRELARAAYREAGGNPFYLRQLAKHCLLTSDLSADTDQQLGHAFAEGQNNGGDSKWSLDEWLWSRSRQLPEEQRRLLELVAIAGSPVQLAYAAKAARVENPAAIVGPLQTDHLVRLFGPEDALKIDTFHDRVREAVIAHLDSETQRECHGNLAHALENADGTDPEDLAVHFQLAGKLQRAGEFYTIGAEQAATGLAFDHAAKLYRQALEIPDDVLSTKRTLRKRLGDALANAGRGTEAAQEYLAACERSNLQDDQRNSDATDALGNEALRRLAAIQLMIAGRLDEGIEVLRDVLKIAGFAMPRSTAAKLRMLLWDSLWLKLRGLRFRRRSTQDIPANEIERLDALWAAVKGLGVVDPVGAFAFAVRQVLLALKAGDPIRVSTNVAFYASLMATQGSATQRKTDRLLEFAHEAKQGIDDAYSEGFLILSRGAAAYLQGRWTPARDDLEQAEQIFRERCTGVAWELDTAQTFLLWCHTYTGSVAELQRRRVLIKEARERGALYAAVNLGTYIMSLDRMAADEMQEARDEVADVMASWSQKGFHVQHHNETLALTNLDLYEGLAADAWHRITQRWDAYRKSWILRIQQTRIDALQSRARSAIGAAVASPDQKADALKDAKQMRRLLLKEKTPWASAWAAYVQAALTFASGDQQKAIHELHLAADQFKGADMLLHATCLNRQRATLLKNNEQLAIADAWMDEQQIRDPEKMMHAIAPGFSL